MLPAQVLLWAFLGLYVAPLAPVPLQVSKETTYFTGPLNADGTVNYVQALNDLNGKGVKPEDNAAVLLFQALGPADNEEAKVPAILQGLGLKPDALTKGGAVLTELPGTPPFTTYEQLVKATTQPWRETDYPTVAQWLKDNEKVIDMVVQASSRKRYYWPLVSPSVPPTVMSVAVPALSKHRLAAQALDARATLKFSSGDIDGACKDTLAVLRLGRLLRQDATLIGQLVGIAIEAQAHRTLVALTNSGRMSAPQCMKLIDTLAAMAPPPPMLQNLERGERADVLDIAVVAGLRGELNLSFLNPPPPPGASAHSPLVKPEVLDINRVLRRLNKSFDELEEAAKLPTYAARTKAFATLDREHRTGAQVAEAFFRSSAASAAQVILPNGLRRAALNHLVTLLIEGGTMPALGTAFRVEARVKMQGQLTEIALALAAYNAEQGQYPKALSDLVPKYLKAVPVDVFTDQPLIYRPAANGYLLCSLGWDLKNQDGKAPGWEYLTIRVPRE